MQYQYNIIFVDKNDIVKAIPYSKNRLPTYREEIMIHHNLKCECCGESLRLKRLVLAGSYKVGEKY